jgi:hypothetical protein
MENIELDLARRIEQVIHAYLKESRAAAAAAVERSFSVGTGPKAPGHEKAQKTKVAKRKLGVRRPADQIKNLRESFFRAVQEHPGETMQALASRIGEQSAVLYRYAGRLRKEGLIRTVGKLQAMRYFPMATGTMPAPAA